MTIAIEKDNSAENQTATLDTVVYPAYHLFRISLLLQLIDEYLSHLFFIQGSLDLVNFS